MSLGGRQTASNWEAAGGGGVGGDSCKTLYKNPELVKKRKRW